MKTIIHINQHNIRSNSRDTTLKPVITAKNYKKNEKGFGAEIFDKNGNIVAKIVYSPNKPLKCGARCWVETELQVKMT